MVRETYFSPSSLSYKQLTDFEIVFRHFVNGGNDGALKMIIQGIVGIKKSDLIYYICHALSTSKTNAKSPFLFLSPTSIASFNIRAKIIHSPSKIPIKDMKPLPDEDLVVFYEEMRHIRYILIEEMSFIGPRLCIQIDSHLREAFPENNDYPIGGSFVILVGDLGK